MISTIHLEYTADMKHMKVTGIDNETVFKHTFYDPVNKVKTNIVFDGTVALCEKVSDYESDMMECENTSTTCVKKFTQESVLTHSDISTFIAWVREYAIQSEFLYDQGLVSGLRFTYKYVESGESFTQRFVTDAERLAWNAKWDYDEAVIKSVKVDNATNADTVGGKTVAADVPAGAKFTDTVYTHPASHPASMITESTTRRFVSDVEKSTWNSKPDTDTITTINGKTGAITKEDITALGIPAQDTVVDISGKADTTYVDSKVQTDVPSGAKFTDTITTINGKTGVITKADIVALGIPAQDTNTTYSEITTDEIDTGTASTLRTITARRLKYLLDKTVALFPSKTSELTNDSGFLTSVNKSDVGLGNVDNTSDLNKPISTATQTALDSKVDDSRVLTDVPLNAEFTDTITTINGKTGIITKADIVALGIPSADTNTITTINGKTGAISKDDIVALGIPSQDTVYTHPPGTNPHGTTKSDVGLGNVTNEKQMPISNGVLENYREKLVTLAGTSTTINLSLGNVFTHTLNGNTTYSITNAVSGQAHSFTLIINMGETARTLTFPASVKWQGGEIPDLTTASKTYVLTFMSVDGGTTWLGMFGGEF